MKHDVDGTMSESEARERGYLPTAEVPALLGVHRDPRELGKTMRREGLSPVRVGQPVGAGVYGRVTEDEEGRLICHECGRPCLSLAAHITRTHGMSAAEYREIYELPRTTKLIAASVRERTGEWAARPENLARLARSRDPQAAADARTADTFRAVSRAQRQRYAQLPE